MSSTSSVRSAYSRPLPHSISPQPSRPFYTKMFHHTTFFVTSVLLASPSFGLPAAPVPPVKTLQELSDIYTPSNPNILVFWDINSNKHWTDVSIKKFFKDGCVVVESYHGLSNRKAEAEQAESKRLHGPIGMSRTELLTGAKRNLGTRPSATTRSQMRRCCSPARNLGQMIWFRGCWVT